MPNQTNKHFEAAIADPSLLLPSQSTATPFPRRLPFHLIEPIVLLSDLAVIFTASLISGIGYQWIFLGNSGDIATFLALGALVFANFFALTSAQQNYRPNNLINFGRQARYVTLNWLFIFFVLITVAFSLKISGTFSRGATFSFLVIGWASLLLFRGLLSRSLKRSLERGAFAQQKIVLIAEHGQQPISRTLAQLSSCGYSPVKTFELTGAELGDMPTKALHQKIQSVISACQGEKIDYIFLLLKWDQPRLINNIVHLLRALPVPVHLLPDETVGSFLSARAGHIGTTLTVELQRTPLTATERGMKRLFDLAVAGLMIALLSPLMLITALLIKIDSSGPVLFRQRRNGFNGSVFSIYKFRTMRVLEDGNRIAQATKGDPRVTRLGRWLRRTSIDELPQLFNVIAGDMSIVGPRPHAVAHNNEYQALVSNYAFRHHVKPGLTGWAQVNGFRGETQTVDLMAKRVEYDLWYINHWSPWLDLRILFMTLLLAYRQPMAY